MTTVPRGGPPVGSTAAEFTSDEFFAMADAEIFTDRRVFLRDGSIYEREPRTPILALTGAKILETLIRILPEGWAPWCENPLRATPRHSPLPDRMIVRGPLRRYLEEDRHPTPADVGLLIEIATSGLPEDLGDRAEVWARGGVPLYWVVDVIGRRVIIHECPETADGRGSYSRITSRGSGEEASLVLDGEEVARIPVAEMLP